MVRADRRVDGRDHRHDLVQIPHGGRSARGRERTEEEH